MIEKILPKSYSFKILRSSLTSNEKFQCEIRAKIGGMEDFSIWLNEFENSTNTCWIVRDSVSSEKSRFHVSKNYVCQHSAYRKKKDGSKNKNCLASLTVRIKRNSKFIRCRDPFARDGYRALIRINFDHSHKLNEPDVWKWLPISEEIREMFIDLFDCGMNPVAARTYHISLLLAECPEYVTNGRLNPPEQWIYNLYQKWQKKNYVKDNTRTKYKSSRRCLSQSEVNKKELKNSRIPLQIEEVDISAFIKCEPDTLFDTSICSKENQKLKETLKQNTPRIRANTDLDLFSDVNITHEESYSKGKSSNQIFGDLVASYLDKLSTLEKQTDARIKITKMLLDELITDN